MKNIIDFPFNKVVLTIGAITKAKLLTKKLISFASNNLSFFIIEWITPPISCININDIIDNTIDKKYIINLFPH